MTSAFADDSYLAMPMSAMAFRRGLRLRCGPPGRLSRTAIYGQRERYPFVSPPSVPYSKPSTDSQCRHCRSLHSTAPTPERCAAHLNCQEGVHECLTDHIRNFVETPDRACRPPVWFGTTPLISRQRLENCEHQSVRRR